MNRALALAKQCVHSFLDSEDASEDAKIKLRHSIAVVQQAAKQFALGELAMSFNGGKDCMLMYIIVLFVIGQPVPMVYIRDKRSFPQVDEFVAQCTEQYELDLTVKTVDMKQAFAEYLGVHPEKKAIFVGIRRQDPWAAELQYIQPTDHGWPAFVRVQPILEWEYHEVWEFLLLCKIPYCKLYDMGYTSLGSMDRTVPNPALKTAGGGYNPAYMLEDNSLERAGRSK